MKRFLLLCKRQFLQPTFLLLCLLLPISCTLISRLEQDSSAAIRIGLYAEAPEAFTDACFLELTSSQEALSFEVFSDEEMMCELVMRGELDCAYCFAKDFHTRLLHNDYKKSILCYTSSGTLMKALSTEVVFSAVFKQLGDDILNGYVENADFSFSRKDNVTEKRLSTLYEKYLSGEQVFSLEYRYLDSFGASGSSQHNSISGYLGATGTSTPTDTSALTGTSTSAVTMPVRGLIAVFLFISGLSGGVIWLQDRERKLPVSALSTILIPLLFMGISSCITLLLTNEAGHWGWELFSLILYVLLILSFVRTLLIIIKRPVILSASIPVLTLGSLIFCPIFINLAALLPVFDIMEKFFLPYYYLLLS